jgi:hypothetical protein
VLIVDADGVSPWRPRNNTQKVIKKAATTQTAITMSIFSGRNVEKLLTSCFI